MEGVPAGTEVHADRKFLTVSVTVFLLFKKCRPAIHASLRRLFKSTYPGGGKYLFPNRNNHERPASNWGILAALKRMGYSGRMTGHGFRSLAMGVIKERLGYRVVDRQLSHQSGDTYGEAYDRAEFKEERKKMMQQYADYLDAVASAGKDGATNKIVTENLNMSVLPLTDAADHLALLERLHRSESGRTASRLMGRYQPRLCKKVKNSTEKISAQQNKRHSIFSRQGMVWPPWKIAGHRIFTQPRLEADVDGRWEAECDQFVLNRDVLQKITTCTFRLSYIGSNSRLRWRVRSRLLSSDTFCFFGDVWLWRRL